MYLHCLRNPPSTNPFVLAKKKKIAGYQVNLFSHFSGEHFRRRQKIMKKSRSCVQSVYSVHANARMMYAVRVATRTYRSNRSSTRERGKICPIQLAFAVFFFQTAVYSFLREGTGSFEYNVEFPRDVLHVTHNSSWRYCCPICFLHRTCFVYLPSKHVKVVTERFIAHYFLSISRY